ncbi:MAG: trypsin-like peptidase domain-containing protein [Acidobacteriaceae bacterium]|nr:trypsin-like peptidase domain-containing protein [Acidobacteriaceae bacterium]
MQLFQKIRQQRLLSFGLLLITLAVGIAIGIITNTGVKAERQVSAVAPDATPLNIPKADPIANDFTKLTKRVEPSVVYIESDYLPKPGKRGVRPKENSEDEDNGENAEPKDPSDVFKHFFGGPQQRSFRTEGSGTGFVVDRNGYIITNQHVVENADRIKVRLAGDNTDYRGRVVGIDKETDLAVLKIDPKGPLVPVQIGNSDSVQVGDWVIAIGSPFGLQATVTAGIISAERTSRDLPGANQFQNFLQTDAAINPGNSGGPLLNTRGEVIGVNTMIATRSGSYEGIGFALPSNMAVKVYNDIIREGRVVRGSIGIRFPANPNQADMMEAFGLNHGVLVEVVAKNGPAGKAGVKADDIITAMNDHPVKDGDELVTKVADMPIGSVATFTVDRNGQKLQFKVPIEERSVVWADELQLSSNRPPNEPEKPILKQTGSAKFGITIVRLTEKERKDLNIGDGSGVKVLAVDPGSFAEDIGMHEGDAILSINRKLVESPDDVMKVQADFKPGQAIAVHVARSAQVGGDRGQPQRYYLLGRLPQP